ncbi:MAG: hypothetical protein GX324_01690 [Aeromonadales bacterium]|nr:hypothetical protein [Aeromonadales bacterium]
MKKRLLLPVLATSVLLTACSETLPQCNDKQALASIELMAYNNVKANFGKQEANSLEFKINSVETLDYNPERDFAHCRAYVDLKMNGAHQTQSESGAFTYTINKTREDQPYSVNVVGF